MKKAFRDFCVASRIWCRGEQVIGGPCREDGEAQQAEQGQTKSERTADHGFHLHVALEAFLLFFCNGPWPIMHGDLRRL